MLATLGEKILNFFQERQNYGVRGETSFHRNSIRQFFHHHRLEELLPYESYEPSQGLFYNRSSLGFVLETLPLVGCTEEMQREVSGLFQHTLPEGSNLQVMLWADPHIGSILEQWEAPRRSQQETLALLAQNRTTFLKDQVYNSQNFPYTLRTFRCVLAYSQKGHTRNPVEIEKILSLKEQIMTTFKLLGLPVWAWDATQLLQFMDSWINLKASSNSLQPSSLQWNPYDSLSLQIPSSETAYQIDETGIVFNEGDVITKTYSVRRYPFQWSLHAMNELIGDPLRDALRIPCPFLIHYGVHVPKQEHLKTKLLSKASYVERQAHSTIGKHIPVLVAEAEELGFARIQLSKGERIVRSNLSIMLQAPKGSQNASINQAEQILLSLFRSKEWELQVDKYIQLQAFLSHLPMNWGEGMVEDLNYIQRLKTTLSTESANLLPIQGEWRGTKSPGMLLAGRRGQLFTWSPFDNDAGNYNVCVVGRSGSGKSVFMQELMTSTLGMGGRVFVLDVGRSFEKTCHLLEGQFIEFKPKTPLCINPFTTIPVDDEESAQDALAMLKSVLSLMAAPTKGTDDMESALLEQALFAVWQEHKNDATISHIAEWLLTHPEKKANDLGTMLFPYTKDGIYGRFFNGASNVNFDNSLVVVELEELKERKDLQSVVVQMVIVHITNQMFLGDRKTPFNIVFDEAWDMLRGNQSGVFVETLARRLRKYNGSLVVGTQSVNDFYASTGALAAFENSDWMCLLSQKKESIEQLKKTNRIAMNGHMETQLASVKTKHGEYAEVMIYGPHGYAICRLLLDPFSQILYSTQADEYSSVKSLQQEGVELVDAIQHIASLRKGG